MTRIHSHFLSFQHCCIRGDRCFQRRERSHRARHHKCTFHGRQRRFGKPSRPARRYSGSSQVRGQRGYPARKTVSAGQLQTRSIVGERRSHRSQRAALCEIRLLEHAAESPRGEIEHLRGRPCFGARFVNLPLDESRGGFDRRDRELLFALRKMKIDRAARSARECRYIVETGPREASALQELDRRLNQALAGLVAFCARSGVSLYRNEYTVRSVYSRAVRRILVLRAVKQNANTAQSKRSAEAANRAWEDKMKAPRLERRWGSSLGRNAP